MTTIDQRIESLEKRLKQEKARKQKIQARFRYAEQKRKRKEDTRKKILFGAIMLHRLDSGSWPRAEQVKGILDESLTRDDDRKLFSLPSRSC